MNISLKKEVLEKEDENYVIISDSLSVLQTITSINENRNYIINLRNKIKYLSIDLFWTKAHVGDVGNEKADVIAMSATAKINIDASFQMTKHQLRAYLDIKYKEIWNNRWNQSFKEEIHRISLRKLIMTEFIQTFI